MLLAMIEADLDLVTAIPVIDLKTEPLATITLMIVAAQVLLLAVNQLM
jgi:hypothetical protein